MARQVNDERLDEVLLRAAKARPYYSSDIWALTCIEKENFPDMCVDQYGRLYYGVEVFDRWNRQEQVAVLLDCVMSMFLAQHPRGKAINAEPMMWQLATQLEKWSLLKEDGWEVPFLFSPEDFHLQTNEVAEVYYDKLQEMADGGGGSGGANQVAKAIKELDRMIQQLASGKGKPEKSDKHISGSIADGQAKPWEGDAPKSESEGMTPSQIERLQKDVKGALEDHIRNRGTVPGRLAEMANAMMEPKVDWRKELRCRIRKSIELQRGNDDFTYSKRPRRQPQSSKFVLPATVSRKLNIGFVIDSSGSMSDVDVGSAVAEVGNILKNLPACDNVYVVVCDAEVGFAHKVFKPEQIQITGRGGTDMRVGITAALEKKPGPDVLIVASDGETPWPSHPLNIPMIVALIHNERAKDGVPHWAQCVVVD